MSTTTTIIPSIPRPQDWPVSLLGPEVGENIDQRLQEARNHELYSVLEIGMMIGGLIRTVELEKLQLQSENRKLEADITQLKMVHAAELNAAVDTREAKKIQVAAKIALLIVKMDAFCNKWCQKGFSFIDASQLRSLSSAVTKINYDHLRAYPKYSDVRKTSPAKDAVTIHTQNPFSLTQTSPDLLQMTLKPMETYQVLLSQTTPIRAANLVLIDTKTMMTDFHAHHLQAIQASQREERFASVLAATRSLYNQVKWQVLTIPYTQCYKCSDLLSDINYEDVSYLHRRDCDPNLEKQIKKMQKLMLDLISTLESFVNLQLTRK